MEVKIANITVKFYNRKAQGPNYWTIAYYDEKRRRKLQAYVGSETDCRTKARDIAVELASGANKAPQGQQPDRVVMNNREAADLAEANTLAARLGTSLHAILQDYAAAQDLLNGTPLLTAIKEWKRSNEHVTAKTVAEVYAEMKSHYDGKVATGDLSTQQAGAVRTFCGRFAGVFAEKTLHQVTAPEIARYIATTGTAANQHAFRRYIVRLFRFAQERGYANPYQKTEAELVSKVRVKNHEAIGIYTPEQAKKVFEKVQAEAPRFLACFVLGAFAGLRPAEIQRLDWSEIHLDQNEIEVASHKCKTGQHRRVAILPVLRAWIDKCQNRSGLVTPYKDERKREKAMTALVHKSLGNQFVPPQDGWRHSYGTYRHANGITVAQLADEMGNSPAVIKRHYRAIVPRANAEAWFGLLPKA